MDRQWRRAGALCRSAPRRRHRRRPGAGEAAPRRPHPGRQPELGKAATARRFRARRPVRRHAGAERCHRQPPSSGRARFAAHRPHLGNARRRHAAGHRPTLRQGAAGAVPCHRRHPLVGPAAIGHLRRYAPAHRRAGGFDRDRRRRKCRRGRHRQQPCQPSCAADPRARRLRRLLIAAANRPPDPRQFQRPRQCRSSARLLRAAGRPSRGQYACTQRSAGATRFLRPQRPPRRLSPRRAARPARADLSRRAGAADARCAGGDCALRHTRRHAAAPPCGDNAAGGVPAERVDHAPSGAGAVLTTASTAVILAAARLRHEGDKSNASRLHHHRRCRRRRSKQSRPAGPHAISGATHRVGGRRADRARPGA